MSKPIPVLLAAAILAHAPAAIGGERLPLTVAEAARLAIERSPELDALASRRAAAAAGVREAESAARPRVDAFAGYSRMSDVPELRIAPTGDALLTIFPNVPDNWRTRLAAEMPLWTAGRIAGGIASARAEERAASAELSAGRADAVLEARVAYWKLVTEIATERVLADARSSYEAHLRDAGNRFDLGLAASNEVLSVRVERDRAELARLAAEGRARVARADLARRLGLPPAVEVEPVEPLDGDPLPPADVEALVTEAIGSRPERAALEARAEAAKEGARVYRSEARPQASVSASWDFADPNRAVLPVRDKWRDTWQVGVGVSWRLYDGGQTSARVARASASAEAIDHRLEDLDRLIRLEVTARIEDVRTASASVAVARANLESARENARVTADRHREGLIPSSERLDAETLLLRAGLDLTEALARKRLALAALDRAVGRRP